MKYLNIVTLLFTQIVPAPNGFDFRTQNALPVRLTNHVQRTDHGVLRVRTTLRSLPKRAERKRDPARRGAPDHSPCFPYYGAKFMDR